MQPNDTALLGVGGWGGVVVPTCTARCLSLREAFYHLDQNILVASGSKSYSE